MAVLDVVFQAMAASLVLVVVTGVKWDLHQELAFYGSYHQNPINQLIHFIFIPIIWWTYCIMMAHLPLFNVPLSVAGHPITWGTVQLAVYAIYYIALDKLGGSIFSAVLLLFYFSAVKMVDNDREKSKKSGPSGKPQQTGMGFALKFAIGMNILAWYMQIHPGHAIYEGIKPTLMDSLSQAFGVAPLFAFYEGLWFVGIAADLKKTVLELVTQHRTQVCLANPGHVFCGLI